MKVKKIKIQDNLSLNLMKTDKFKTVAVAIYFKGIVQQDSASDLSILAGIMNENCQAYPTRQALQSYKEYLYQLGLSATNVHFGGASYFSITADLVAPYYVAEQLDILDKVFQLIHQIVYQPLLKGQEFDKTTFEMVRNNQIQNLKRMSEQKETYMMTKLSSFLLQDHPYKVSNFGSLEGLATASSKKVYAVYQEVIARPIDVYVVGDVDEDLIVEKIKQYIQPGKNTYKYDYLVPLPSNGGAEYVESSYFSQSQIANVYLTPAVVDLQSDVVANIFNDLFGGLASSKLFKVVREEYNYCYTISSLLRVLSGSMLVLAGIDDNNYRSTQELIALQLQALQKGDFSEPEIELVKGMLKARRKAVFDSNASLIISLLNYSVSGIDTNLDAYNQMVDSISKKEIMEFANKVTLSYTYYLKQGGNA